MEERKENHSEASENDARIYWAEVGIQIRKTISGTVHERASADGTVSSSEIAACVMMVADVLGSVIRGMTRDLTVRKNTVPRIMDYVSAIVTLPGDQMLTPEEYLAEVASLNAETPAADETD